VVVVNIYGDHGYSIKIFLYIRGGDQCSQRMADCARYLCADVPSVITAE